MELQIIANLNRKSFVGDFSINIKKGQEKYAKDTFIEALKLDDLLLSDMQIDILT